MVWKSEKLIVECESNLAHGQYANIARDSKRRNELLGEGYEVITLTYSEMLSSTYFNSFIKNVSKRIGYRIRPEYLSMTEARLALRKLALGSTQQSS